MSLTKKCEYVPYEYRHAPVPGGGFVTGFAFHRLKKGILYARTDIGGVYRYNFDDRTWHSLVDHVTAPGKWETYPLSIALDDNHPEWLYIAAGDWKHNYLCRSKDMGRHFEYFEIPAGVHGNAPGRGTGERLIVDPVDPGVIYFGSQTNGLLISEDHGEHWRELPVCPVNGKPETDIAFVWLDPRSGSGGRCSTIVVSASGKDNSPVGNVRGPSLYISRDGGRSFSPMPGQPSPPDIGNYPGFVGQRAAFDGRYLYVTMASVVNSWAGWRGYACDMGGAQLGCVIRYELAENGDIRGWKYITPDMSLLTESKEAICRFSGFGGISADTSKPGRLVCSTQCCAKGDAVFYSEDFGETWTQILHGLTIGQMDFDGVPYMKPEYNGGGNLIHWLSDIKIDPFDSDRAVFNTGTGIFMTENLCAAAEGGTVVWKPSCKGLEETVHLNLYSPPKGEVRLIDIIGDLGGFAFTDLTKPAENSFADENGNRYITCLNADFPDDNPWHIAVTARGNWTGKTTGGLIWSEDQCRTWTRRKDPTGLTERIDRLIDAIRRPNTNSGWVAVSADGRTLVWSLAEGSRLPVDAVVYTDDLGSSWNKCRVYDLEGNIVDNEQDTLKVMSDRVDPEVFYGFGDGSRLYISRDRARTFHEIQVPSDFPALELGGIDGRMPAEIRAESGKTGVIWISTGEQGLWKIIFDKLNGTADFRKVSADGDVIYRQGMGKAAPDSDCKTLYVNGIIKGEYGFYRSFDEGRTWQRINSASQMFGDIRSIAGDPRVFGLLYIATGTRGVLWGQPAK
ncbi:MAG TPA: sialidase family protein [Candidatus Atribacteria bacterium]|nr:sialidase family protein [Candidatus Atribacteria bacterium]